MRTIKDVCPTVIDAIEAMIWGLENIPNKRYRINMGTFGDNVGAICYGCAATYATLSLQKDNINDSLFRCREYRAEFIGLDYSETLAFEHAIDDFRSGNLAELFDLYDEDIPVWARDNEWYLGSDDWQEGLEKVKLFLSKLKEEKNES